MILPKSENDINGLLHRNKYKYTISASSVQTEGDVTKYIENLVDYSLGTSKWWCSNNVPFQYFEIDFEDNPVLITNYTFYVGDWGASNSYPKSWDVTGFFQGKEFYAGNITDSGINGPLSTHVYSTDLYGPFSKIRFTLRETYISRRTFCLCKFDLFGDYVRNIKYKSICPSLFINLKLSCVQLIIMS